MLDAVGGLLLHLGQDIADDLGVVVGRLLGARDIDGDVGQLGPRQGVVQVVLHKVVLGQVLEVGVLDQRDVARLEAADVHCCWAVTAGDGVCGLRRVGAMLCRALELIPYDATCRCKVWTTFSCWWGLLCW